MKPLLIFLITALSLAPLGASFAQIRQLQNGSCNAAATLNCPCPNGQAPIPGLGCSSSPTGANDTPCQGLKGSVLADCLVEHRKHVASQKYLTPDPLPMNNSTQTAGSHHP